MQKNKIKKSAVFKHAVIFQLQVVLNTIKYKGEIQTSLGFTECGHYKMLKTHKDYQAKSEEIFKQKMMICIQNNKNNKKSKQI